VGEKLTTRAKIRELVNKTHGGYLGNFKNRREPSKCTGWNEDGV